MRKPNKNSTTYYMSNKFQLCWVQCTKHSDSFSRKHVVTIIILFFWRVFHHYLWSARPACTGRTRSGPNRRRRRPTTSSFHRRPKLQVAENRKTKTSTVNDDNYNLERHMIDLLTRRKKLISCKSKKTCNARARVHEPTAIASRFLDKNHEMRDEMQFFARLKPF